MDVLKNRLEAQNKVNKYIRETVPALVEDLCKNGISVTKNNMMFQRDKNRVNELVKKHLPDDLQAFTSLPYGSDGSYYWLEIKTSYKNSECTCAYIKEAMYISKKKDFDPDEWPEYNLKSVLKAQKEMSAIRDKISKLADQYSKLKRKALFPANHRDQIYL